MEAGYLFETSFLTSYTIWCHDLLLIWLTRNLMVLIQLFWRIAIQFHVYKEYSMRLNLKFTLKMEAGYLFETSFLTSYTIRCHDLEDYVMNLHCHKNINLTLNTCQHTR
jgi:hypothetical protein